MDRASKAETGSLKLIEAGKAEGVCCPHCGQQLLELTQGCARVVAGGTWLDDGDCVPGVVDQLPGGYGHGNDACLMVGTCPGCRGHYWVAEATLLAGSWDQLDAFLSGEAPLDDEAPARFYAGSWGRSRWWMVEQETPDGPVHQHCFGPFALSAIDELRGPNGVAACGQRARAPAWSQARELLLEVWPRLSAWHAAVPPAAAGGSRSAGTNMEDQHAQG